MSKPTRRRITATQVAHEQYALERRGHDAGELTEPAGGERSRATEDYSTSGLFRDENFARDSCGSGEGRAADRSWEGDLGRSPDLYRDTAESEFTVRSAAGLEEESPSGVEQEELPSEEPLSSPRARGSARRRRTKR